MYASLNNLHTHQTYSFIRSSTLLRLKAGVYLSHVYFILSHDDSLYRALENACHRKRQVKYILYKIGKLFCFPQLHVSNSHRRSSNGK